MRKILGFGVLLGLLIALSSCGSLTGGETLVSVEIELPAEAEASVFRRDRDRGRQ